MLEVVIILFDLSPKCNNRIPSKVSKKASSQKNVVARSLTVTHLAVETDVKRSPLGREEETEGATYSAPTSTTSSTLQDTLHKVHIMPWTWLKISNSITIINLWPSSQWSCAGFAKGPIIFSSFKLPPTSSVQLQGPQRQVSEFFLKSAMSSSGFLLMSTNILPSVALTRLLCLED